MDRATQVKSAPTIPLGRKHATKHFKKSEKATAPGKDLRSIIKNDVEQLVAPEVEELHDDVKSREMSSTDIINDDTSEIISLKAASDTTEDDGSRRRNLGNYGFKPLKVEKKRNKEMHFDRTQFNVRSAAGRFIQQMPRSSIEQKQDEILTARQSVIEEATAVLAKDEDTIFALSLIPFMRKLNDDQKGHVKMEFMNLLQKTGQFTLNGPNTTQQADTSIESAANTMSTTTFVEGENEKEKPIEVLKSKINNKVKFNNKVDMLEGKAEKKVSYVRKTTKKLIK